MPTGFEKHEGEDKWFKKYEEELIEVAKEKKRIEDEKRLKELHYMHCPKCGNELYHIEVEGTYTPLI